MEISNINLQHAGALSILQFKTDETGEFQYIALNEALKNKYLKITEVNKAGSVNEIILENTSDKFIFMMDGDVLEGAKQNRVVNSSVLVAPHSKIILPVSCVEQGRWSFKSEHFGTAEYIAPTELRAKKAKRVRDSLRSTREFASNQSEVWDDVRFFSNKFSVNSPTQNLSDIFQKKSHNIDEFVKQFKINPDSNGIAIFLRNDLHSIDIFHSGNIYRTYFKKILKGAALDVLNLKNEDEAPDKAEAYYKTVTLLDELAETGYSVHNGVGVGTEKRYDSYDYAAFELWFTKYLIHLTVLNSRKKTG